MSIRSTIRFCSSNGGIPIIRLLNNSLLQLKVVKPATAQNKETKITVTAPGTTLFAEKTCDTFEEGVDLAIDALKVQLARFKEKTR